MVTWVADIGGSSSRWARIAADGSAELREELPGFNPNSGDPEALLSALSAWTGPNTGEASDVFVYGAGCGNVEAKARMVEAMRTIWPAAIITVETDLLGAARGMYGDDEGLILILGTGMNCGRYTHTELHTPMPSLGWLLGDEGSGADLGRTLLREALLGRLSTREQALVFPEGMDRAQLMQSAYRPMAQQAFFASFAKRLSMPGAEELRNRLIEPRFKALGELLSRFFPREEGSMVKAVGSIAWAFEEQLKSALSAHGLLLTEVQRSPMSGLIRFHSTSRS